MYIDGDLRFHVSVMVLLLIERVLEQFSPLNGFSGPSTRFSGQAAERLSIVNVYAWIRMELVLVPRQFRSAGRNVPSLDVLHLRHR